MTGPTSLRARARAPLAPGRRRTALTARWCLLASLWAAVPLLGVTTAHAAPIPWRSMQIDYVADHKALRDVLRDVSASAGVPIWISPKVDGNVTGHFQSSPQQLLNRMSSSFGFVWYYDGSVLRIYGSDEITNATIGLRTASTADLRRSLSRLAVNDRRFPVRYDDEARTAVVSGPPRYVELIGDIAKLVDQNHQLTQRGQAVRVFPLRYAWASDHTVTVDGQSIKITGVATILRSLYEQGGGPIGSQTAPQADARRLRNVADSAGGGGGADVGTGGGSRPRAAASNGGWTVGLPGLLGGGGGGGASPGAPFPQGDVASGSDGDDDDGDVAPRRSRSRRSRTTDVYAEDRPVITPDPRTNSILVRGQPDHMASFESLIASLDVRPAVVEIDASIIEITDNALEQLGVDWRAHSGHTDIETGNGTNTLATSTSAINPSGFNTSTTAGTSSVTSTTPVGGVFTAVLGGAGRYLLARISALQQTDQATLNASPKVATLDNVEAVMDNKQTFYVPVSGYQSADLYSISAGVSLRVLPMIVRGSGDAGETPHIRLNVHIEDGQLTTQTVSSLPVVSNSTIDTQALINQGESLLIAGYAVDQDERQGTGVPGLSKIPLIGGLFRYKSHTGQKFQRLFLVTPRILTPAGAYQQDSELGMRDELNLGPTARSRPDRGAQMGSLQGDGRG
ncbi:type III secretion system outer membrane ring subunit SctC [Robbsia sp. Bb-Pol-6]|uniref:Type 3 secretion system secretin n=2 Tax=Robbsia betulipollinis TaxID=2981849 RepID=A0ABT3ZLD0_9BURK|nr:type III secretion system outer membrane ring subunit SctC [Robbsia betulipollinis]MCY0387075.1 type III secretion system outer membrane ring subunit SctC [Robbsia betulipollinis]